MLAIFFYSADSAVFQIFHSLSDLYNDYYGYCNFSSFNNITYPYVIIGMYYTISSVETTTVTLQVSVTNNCNYISGSFIFYTSNSAAGILPLGSAIAIGIIAGALFIIATVVFFKYARCRPNHTKEVPDEAPDSTAM